MFATREELERGLERCYARLIDEIVDRVMKKHALVHTELREDLIQHGVAALIPVLEEAAYASGDVEQYLAIEIYRAVTARLHERANRSFVPMNECTDNCFDTVLAEERFLRMWRNIGDLAFEDQMMIIQIMDGDCSIRQWAKENDISGDAAYEQFCRIVQRLMVQVQLQYYCGP